MRRAGPLWRGRTLTPKRQCTSTPSSAKCCHLRCALRKARSKAVMTRMCAGAAADRAVSVLRRSRPLGLAMDIPVSSRWCAHV